ncbi:MAG: hypothetical protein M1122_02525 [Candidatus Marsarchaeota archaeon]|jgi:hypothetical protein|nr:hypothetical protein [Candidatus Marsarchaeota archaeon]
MDHRDNIQHDLYKKDLEESKGSKQTNNEFITLEGKSYRVPYSAIKEVTFSNVNRNELIDLEHAARLQYRLMLQDSILRAKVEFIKQTITVVYNPSSATNRKPKISFDELVKFLANEGVHVENLPREERDFDYIKEMYNYHYNPPAIREHPPYGYTAEEWRKMKADYLSKLEKMKHENTEKFVAWQKEYEAEHPEVFGEKAVSTKKSAVEKLFGRKGSGKDKGFWFHGV